jgi:hypothetical protein
MQEQHREASATLLGTYTRCAFMQQRNVFAFVGLCHFAFMRLKENKNWEQALVLAS